MRHKISFIKGSILRVEVYLFALHNLFLINDSMFCVAAKREGHFYEVSFPFCGAALFCWKNAGESLRRYVTLSFRGA